MESDPMAQSKRFRFFSALGHHASILWTNLPWQFTHPDKVEVTGGGHIAPDEPDEPVEVQDYQACVRGAGDGLTTLLLLDPRKATAEEYKKFLAHFTTQCQLVAWWWGGHANMAPAAMPPNAGLVLPAHDAVQEHAAVMRRHVAAPFMGLDLKVLQGEATHLGYVRKMELTTGALMKSLERVDAWESGSIVQRLRPIWEEAYPVVRKLGNLEDALSPLNKLFAGAAELAVETKTKIAAALLRRGGTPSAGTPPGTGGEAPGTGTPAPAAPGSTTDKKPTT
jgi:hypothetical protein